MRKLLVSACLAGLAAQPLAAQKMPTAVAEAAIRLMNHSSDRSVLAGAYLACLVGGGDPERTAMIFSRAGWPRNDESGLSMIEFQPPGAPNPYISIGADYPYCGVWTGVISTYVATEILDNALADLSAAGFDAELGTSTDGCIMYRMGRSMTIEVTSSGQDPTCTGEDSAVHFSGVY